MAKKREKPASDAPRPARMAVIYTRQSRDRNAVFSSCDMQRSICKDFADGFGWEVCETFEDVGGSSESIDRPSLRRLLQSVEAGGVDRIIVYSVDRLTRKLLHLQVLLQAFDQHDVSLHVVTDPQFGSSASARLMSNIIAAASEFQQDLTRERLAEARAALKQKGRRVAGRVPYGYVTDRNSKQLIIDPTEAKRVRKIFELAVSGKPPCRGVSVKAFEIEQLVCSIIGQSEEDHESSADTHVEAFRSVWSQLDERTQTKLLATIIKEVVFDPDAGSIQVTLVDDAAERIMTTTSDRSSTR